MIKKFRKKPIVIEAIQWSGDNIAYVAKLAGDLEIETDLLSFEEQLVIPTLEGSMRVSKGDYIIKGVKGEIYPCKPDIFEKTYEPVD